MLSRGFSVSRLSREVQHTPTKVLVQTSTGVTMSMYKNN